MPRKKETPKKRKVSGTKEEETKESPKKRKVSGAKDNDEKNKPQIIESTVGADDPIVKVKNEEKKENDQSIDEDNDNFIKPPEEGYENSQIESNDFEISPDIKLKD